MELSQTISNLIFEIQKLTQAVEKISKTQEISVDVLDEAIAFNGKEKITKVRSSRSVNLNSFLLIIFAISTANSPK